MLVVVRGWVGPLCPVVHGQEAAMPASTHIPGPTGEPAFADAAPLTSEPPLADATPLTSEPPAPGTAGGLESPGV